MKEYLACDVQKVIGKIPIDGQFTIRELLNILAQNGIYTNPDAVLDILNQMNCVVLSENGPRGTWEKFHDPRGQKYINDALLSIDRHKTFSYKPAACNGCYWTGPARAGCVLQENFVNLVHKTNSKQ